MKRFAVDAEVAQTVRFYVDAENAEDAKSGVWDELEDMTEEMHDPSATLICVKESTEEEERGKPGVVVEDLAMTKL